MDSNDATILTLALGIPSATLLSIAFLLALRIEHRQLQARRIRNSTVPTNSPTPSPPPVNPYYGIPLEQRPPRILAPLPRRPIPFGRLNRATRLEEDLSRSISPVLPAPRPPTPPRRRTPIIIVFPTTSTDDHPYAPRSPSPGEYAHYRDNGRGFDMGRDIRVTALPPVTILGMPILQHPQLLSVQVSSGITSPPPSVPISLHHTTDRLSTEPPPPVSPYTQH